MPANILLSIITGFLGGVFVASFFSAAYSLLYPVLIIAPFLLTVFWKYKNVRYFALFAVFFVLGILRFNAVANNYFNTNADYLLPAGVSFTADVVEVDSRDTKQNLIVSPIPNTALPEDAENGNIRVTTDNFTEYETGEHIIIEGELKKPENFTEDFNWVGYLAKEGIGYVMNKPIIEKTGKKETGIHTVAARSKKMLRSGIESSLLPPHSSLYRAMLIGDKAGLSSKDRDRLQRAGLSHIVAISGMHIAIVTMALTSLLVGAGLWRRHALYAAIGILIFYILIIGAPASAGRAGIMAAVAILAERLGRPNSSWRALLLAAAVMIALNPLLLRYDIGFQLSYLAVFGIITFSDKILAVLQNIYDRIVLKMFPGYVTKDRPLVYYGYERVASGVGGMVSVTMAAQIFTLPVILYNFGYVSPWSILSNLLVLPVLGYALGAGFVAASLGSIGGIITASPAWIFSNYIWFIVDLFNI